MLPFVQYLTEKGLVLYVPVLYKLGRKYAGSCASTGSADGRDIFGPASSISARTDVYTF